MINSNVHVGTFLGKTISIVPTKPSTPLVGQMFIDNKIGECFIYTGSDWVMLTSVMPIGTVTVALEDLCETHPGLKELKKELDEAKEKFDAFLALVKEHQNNANS